MKKENLNNKKQEWVTPEIKELILNDNEGKGAYIIEQSSFNRPGPS